MRTKPDGGGLAAGRLKMKDLERATGVGRESIRFYIREGLLPEPQRPARNVAWYDESFVERIRLIKELQQKRFLPLHVIKAVVAGDATPTPHEVDVLLHLDRGLSPRVRGGGTQPSERLSAVSDRTAIPAREILDLAATGAIEVATRDGDQWLAAAAVRVVELWARLRAVGFTTGRGFGPERIRLYVDVAHLLAREEVRLFAAAVAGRVPGDDALRMAEEGIEIGSELIALLRREALLRFIAQGNLTETPPAGTRSGSDAS